MHAPKASQGTEVPLGRADPCAFIVVNRGPFISFEGSILAAIAFYLSIVLRCDSKGMRLDLEKLLARARILSSPTRLDLWCSLGSDGMRPSELARMHNLAASTVTYHMQMLRRARLVELVGSGAGRRYRWSDEELILASRAELDAGAI
jgi:DNA-binding transcriptional ArsR family regulator